MFEDELKHVADHLGVCSQCVMARNVTKISSATISNLCLKINGKMGGINTIPQEMSVEYKIIMLVVRFGYVL